MTTSGSTWGSAKALRALRGPKVAVDPWAAPRVVVEQERVGATVAPAVAVFLIGRECPWTCVFCDLWRHTLDGPTALGSLPHQLELARRSLGGSWPRGAVLKLYNAASFFDPLAVPAADLEALATLCAGAARVVVECHPQLVVRHESVWRAFAAAVAPAKLEIGLGLETANEPVHRGLGKGTTVALVAQAGAMLVGAGVAWRAFVLVGTPGVAAADVVADAVATTAWARARGAAHVALIVVRTGNGALDQLAQQGLWSRPTLATLERVMGGVLSDSRQGDAAAAAVVSADLWDLAAHSTCRLCFGSRQGRLEHANTWGQWVVLRPCRRCGEGA